MRPTVLRFLVLVLSFGLGLGLSAVVSYLGGEKFEISALRFEENDAAPVLIFEFRAPDSPIRKVDFANFDYPGLAGMPRVLRVRNGKRPPKRRDAIGRPLDLSLGLADVRYGDVTGDGKEDAIVDLYWETGGTAHPNLIYIFTMMKNRPRLLWAFETGDRADGGLKGAFAQSGDLTVELYGKDKIIGRDLYAYDGVHVADCCPTLFTRTRYVWNGRRFRQTGSSEVLPVPIQGR